MPCKGKSKEFIATAKKMCRKEKNTVWNNKTCLCELTEKGKRKHQRGVAEGMKGVTKAIEGVVIEGMKSMKKVKSKL